MFWNDEGIDSWSPQKMVLGLCRSRNHYDSWHAHDLLVKCSTKLRGASSNVALEDTTCKHYLIVDALLPSARAYEYICTKHDGRFSAPTKRRTWSSIILIVLGIITTFYLPWIECALRLLDFQDLLERNTYPFLKIVKKKTTSSKSVAASK